MIYCHVVEFILQGGGIVRFFHRTHECYIVAEGSFAGRFASIETIESIVQKRKESPRSIRNDIQTEFSVDLSHQDTPLLGSHTQLVEAEVYESSDQGDSMVKSALPSIHSHELKRAKRMYSREGSLELYDQATSDHAGTIQRSPSLDVDLSDEEYQHVVTNDGK